MPDPVVHFEIPAQDLERARRFYRETFGWTTDAPPGQPYALMSTAATGPDGRPQAAGSINGALLRRTDPVRNVVVTIQVPSIDAAAPKIAQGGGRLVRAKAAVGTVGFAAYFEDPEGNVVGLWEPRRP